MSALTLEVKQQADKTGHFVAKGAHMMVTPVVSEGYWIFRVRLSKKQAIVGFPKFTTIGIGFEVEGADWNTNLPWRCDAEEIYEHIKHNKGDPKIRKATCIAAIRLVQDAARQMAEPPKAKA